MSKLEFKESELLILLHSLVRAKFDLNETIKIYSTDNIDDHFLGDPDEPTYREEIEKIKSEIQDIDTMHEKISKAIYDLKNNN